MHREGEEEYHVALIPTTRFTFGRWATSRHTHTTYRHLNHKYISCTWVLDEKHVEFGD